MTEHSTSSIAADSAVGRVDSTTVAWGADRAAIDQALEQICVHGAESLVGAVREAVRYALLGGGKRIRGLLMLAAYRTAGGRSNAAALAAAIEVVHAYSLVHDDLPCMDDDDMRRGRPTAHRVYGIPVATAAGLAMVPLASRAAFDAALDLGLDEQAAARVVATLMRASGAGGMIGGQLLDLEGEARPLTLEELERIHRAKTGALISASVVLGGVVARADPRIIAALQRFGDAIGLAFQIADDVLDVTGSTAMLGKQAGRDLDLRKSTYPALLGIETASRRAEDLIADGLTALREVGLLTMELDALARFVIERQS
ncbi:MAG TPA: farnesyl diphosphate synthase [Gemmatimonadaceae bacterium]